MQTYFNITLFVFLVIVVSRIGVYRVGAARFAPGTRSDEGIRHGHRRWQQLSGLLQLVV